MFRSLIFVIAIGLVIWLVSRMLKNKLGNNSTSRSQNPKEIKNIVQCHQCKAFIPEDRVVREGGQTFCSQKHLEEWKESQ